MFAGIKLSLIELARIVCLLPLVISSASLLSGQDGILDELAAGDPCSVRLFSALKTFQPGVSFEVGVLVEPGAGWHGYWHSARDGGDAPEVIWDLPEEWKVSGPEFPVPERMVEPGDLVSIGYKKPFLLRFRLHPVAMLIFRKFPISYRRYIFSEGIYIPKNMFFGEISHSRCGLKKDSSKNIF